MSAVRRFLDQGIGHDNRNQFHSWRAYRTDEIVPLESSNESRKSRWFLGDSLEALSDVWGGVRAVSSQTEDVETPLPELYLRDEESSTPTYACSFNFLQCERIFLDADEWATPSSSHLGERIPPKHTSRRSSTILDHMPLDARALYERLTEKRFRAPLTDDDLSTDRRLLYINNGTGKIPRSLDVTFSALRAQHARQFLWVDGLCINQGHRKYMVRQTAMMRDIYGQVVRTNYLPSNLKLTTWDESSCSPKQLENHTKVLKNYLFCSPQNFLVSQYRLDGAKPEANHPIWDPRKYLPTKSKRRRAETLLPWEDIVSRANASVSAAARHAISLHASRSARIISTLMCAGASTVSTVYAWTTTGLEGSHMLTRSDHLMGSGHLFPINFPPESHMSSNSYGALQKLLQHKAALPSALAVFSLTTTALYTLHDSDEHQDGFILVGILGGLGFGAANGMGLKSILLAVLPWTILAALLISALVHAFMRLRGCQVADSKLSTGHEKSEQGN